MARLPDGPPPPESAPFVPWEQFYDRFDWRQGEHVALVGPTGRGKTTLALSILPKRSWAVIIGTKPKDDTLSGLRKFGWHRIPEWPPPARRNRVILWPKWKGDGDSANQARVIREAIDKVFHQHAWCVFMDDTQYLTDHLGLGRMLRMMWLQGRSINVSTVAATQRPVWVPREMWSQSTHHFIWGTQDEQDLKALGGFGGMNAGIIRRWVANLGEHEVLYLNTRNGTMLRTQAPRRPER